MVKRIFLVFSMALSGFLSADGLNAINDPVMNPCIQRPDLAGCGANGSVATQRVYKVPNRWGAIYYCINAGGGQNPLHRDGKGCRKMTEVRNACSAIAGGSKSYSAKSDDYLEKAERKALDGCSQYSNDCKIFYSGCSRHPDYRY